MVLEAIPQHYHQAPGCSTFMTKHWGDQLHKLLRVSEGAAVNSHGKPTEKRRGWGRICV